MGDDWDFIREGNIKNIEDNNKTKLKSGHRVVYRLDKYTLIGENVKKDTTSRNVICASFVSRYARIKLHQVGVELIALNLNSKIIYLDTDSLFLQLNKDQELINPRFYGGYELVCENTCSFVAIASNKLYTLTLTNGLIINKFRGIKPDYNLIRRDSVRGLIAFSALTKTPLSGIPSEHRFAKDYFPDRFNRLCVLLPVNKKFRFLGPKRKPVVVHIDDCIDFITYICNFTGLDISKFYSKTGEWVRFDSHALTQADITKALNSKINFQFQRSLTSYDMRVEAKNRKFYGSDLGRFMIRDSSNSWNITWTKHLGEIDYEGKFVDPGRTCYICPIKDIVSCKLDWVPVHITLLQCFENNIADSILISAVILNKDVEEFYRRIGRRFLKGEFDHFHSGEFSMQLKQALRVFVEKYDSEVGIYIDIDYFLENASFIIKLKNYN